MLKSLFTGFAVISLALLLTVSLSAPHVSATQGTCSWHGGVSCSAGTDWDGSAICNDGWRDSSEVYSQVKECSTSSRPVCTSEELTQLEIKYGLPEIKQRWDNISGRMDALSKSSLSTTDTNTLRNNVIESSKLYIEFLPIQAEYQNAFNRATADCYELGAKEEQQFRDNLYKQLQSQAQTQNTVRYSCPSNSILNGDKCYCPNGTNWNGSSCVVSAQGQVTQTTLTDPYAQLTNDERCVKLGFGTFFNTDKQSCDSCPPGTTKVVGTNTCQTPISVIKKVEGAPKEKIQTQTIPVIKIPDVKSVNSSEVATTTTQATTSSVQTNLPTPKPRTFFEKFTSPLKSFWGRFFK